MRGPDSVFKTRFNWDASPNSNKPKPDKDTLYFLTDDNGQTELWLGDSLISSGNAIDALSPEAQEYLNKITDSLTGNEPLNTGDFLIYDAVENTWVPSTVGPFIGATENADGQTGMVPAPASYERDMFLRGDGSWADLTSEVLPLVLQRILGDDEGNINDSYDTIKEISDWILSHPSGVEDLNRRLTNLENAVGLSYHIEKVQATDEQGNPLTDEQGNPIYEQEPVYQTDENGQIVTDEYGQPVQEVELVETTDEHGDSITIEVPKTKDKEILVQDNVPNDIQIIKTVIGHLNPNDTLYPSIVNQSVGTLTDRLTTLETNFSSVTKTVVISQNESKLVLKDVGNLSDLLVKKDDNTTPVDLVDAINTLDERMQWKELIVEQQENNP